MEELLASSREQGEYSSSQCSSREFFSGVVRTANDAANSRWANEVAFCST